MGFLKCFLRHWNRPVRDRPPAVPSMMRGPEEAAAPPLGHMIALELGYYVELLGSARRARDRHKEWETLENIGDSLRRGGAHQEAADYYRQALELAREIDDQRRQVGSLFSLSDVLAKVGEAVQAGQCRNEALTIARKSKGAILSDVGVHLAGDTRNEEYLRRAIRLFELHLQLAREAGSRAGEEAALGNLGIAYLERGYLHRAVDCFKKALVIAREIADKDGEQAALGSLGRAYQRVGDMHKATEYFGEALELGRESGSESRLAGNAFNMARMFVQQGDLERALPLAREAAEIYERRRDSTAERAKELVARILSARQ
jgi:tetratricopeptide (TPR) repeat protein